MRAQLKHSCSFASLLCTVWWSPPKRLLVLAPSVRPKSAFKVGRHFPQPMPMDLATELGRGPAESFKALRAAAAAAATRNATRYNCPLPDNWFEIDLQRNRYFFSRSALSPSPSPLRMAITACRVEQMDGCFPYSLFPCPEQLRRDLMWRQTRVSRTRVCLRSATDWGHLAASWTLRRLSLNNRLCVRKTGTA